jgi:hypothetical protein
LALLVAGGAQVAGADQVGRSAAARPVVVVASPALASDPAAVAAVSSAGAQLRVPRSATEQLSVTHLFAARGYAIVGAGLSRRVAVDPVARRYPATRFTLLPASPRAAALRAALGTATAP